MFVLDRLACSKPSRDSAGLPDCGLQTADASVVRAELNNSTSSGVHSFLSLMLLLLLLLLLFLFLKQGEAPVSLQCGVISLYAQCGTSLNYLHLSLIFYKVSLACVRHSNNEKRAFFFSSFC